MKANIPSLSIERNHRLWVGCAIALGLHGLLILPFLVSPEGRTGLPQSPVEVTIANPQAQQTPDQASFESLADQLGGGDNDSLQRLTSQELGRETQHDSQADQDQKGQTDETGQESSQGWIATTGNESMLRLPGEIYLTRMASKQDKTAGEEKQNVLADLDLQAEQLRGFGQADRTSVATLKSATAAYINRWRQRIETIGTRKSQATRLLTGSVELWAQIGHKGQLLDYRVLRSSGDPRVDQAAKDILTQSAPFDPFPSAMLASQTTLEIKRVWQFRLGAPTLRP